MNIKSTLSRFLSLTFFFFLSIDSALSWVWNLYEYRDLEGTNAEVFAAEASQWTASLLAGYQKFYPCGTTYLLGGYSVLGTVAGSYPAGYGYQGTDGQYGQYFTRTFTLLPSHSMIYYTMTFWVLDNWKGPASCWMSSSTCQDHWDLTIAGSTYSGWVFDYGTYYNGLPNLCGAYPSDFPNIKLFGRVSHSATTLTITITSRLAQQSYIQSWGIREVNILSAASPSYPGYITSLCARAPYSLPSSTISTCDCPQGSYLYYSGMSYSCPSCHYTCISCFEYGPQYCYECASGYYWDGYQCTTLSGCYDSCLTCTGSSADECTSCVPGAYLYNGNTCIPSCPSPLIITTISSVPNCVFPCGPELFLDWNNVCQPFCDFPLQTTMTNTLVGPVPRCIYPCSTSQWLYWDGSCQTSCPSPFFSYSIRSRNFCNYTCPTEPNSILYWDGSCNSTMCQFPIQVTIQYSKTFCTYPCTTGQWLYSNGSCLSYCQDHFIPGSFAGQLFCNFPCPLNLYLLDNGTCSSTCWLNYVNITLRYEKYCFYPCLPTEYYYSTNGSCLSYCDWRFIYSTYSSQNYCAHPCTASQYLYLNGSCLTYCEPYYTPWFDYNRKYCENPCNNSVIYSNGTCSNSCATSEHFIAGSRGSDLTCTYPCRPSEYLYTNGSCLPTCSPHYIPLTYGTDDFCEYPCAASQYLYSNGTCLSTCNTPYTGYLYGGDPICVAPCDTEYYYYNNGSCLANCPSLFIENIYGTEKFCYYPCDTLEYLYINGSCLSSCRSDFVIQTYGTDNYCNYPCSPDEYLYDNKSCISSCLSPWTNETTIFGRFCHFPCADPSDYSYWNGTCSPLCPFPLKSYTEGSFSFCVSPCTSNQFLYSNGLCVSSCPSPYISSTVAQVNYCQSPCTSTSEYLFWNGSCIEASCLYPFRAKYSGTASALCLLPCDNITHYLYFEEGVCRGYCNYEAILRPEGYLECEEAPDFLDWISTPPIDANTMTTVVLSKNLVYLRYFNIQLPPRLERLRAGGGKFVLTFKHGAVVPSLFYEGFDMKSLPENFEKRGAHSSFFINFWNLLTFMMVFFGLGLIFTFLEYQFKAWNLRYWRLIMERLKTLLLWNFFIILFANNADFIVLYSSLELQTLSFNNFAAVFSFIFCIIVCVLTLAVPIASYYLGYAIYQQKKRAIQAKSNDDYLKFLEKWENFQVLFRGFNTDSPLQTIFYAIYTIRIASPMAAASFLYDVPLAQVAIDLVLSITIILYLAVLRPMKRMVNNIQLLLLELLILAVNICMTIFAINDLFDINLTYRMASLGDAVIVCNFLMNILVLVILGYKAFWILKNAWDLRKKDGLHTLMSLIQLVFLPIQQTAFGFETIQISRFDTTYHDLNEDFYSDKKFDPTIQAVANNKKVNKSLFESSSNEILETSGMPLTNNNSNTSLIRAPLRLNQSQNRLRIAQNRNANSLTSQELKQLHESPNNPSKNIPRISSRIPTDNSSQSALKPSLRYDSSSRMIRKDQEIELTPSQDFNQESSVEIGYHRPPIIPYDFADPVQQGQYRITGNDHLVSQDYDFAPETDDRYYLSHSREIPSQAILYDDARRAEMSRAIYGDQQVMVTDRDQDFTNRSQMFSGVRFLSPIPHNNMLSFSPSKDAGDDLTDAERSAKKRR